MTWPPRCVQKRLPNFPYTGLAEGTEVSGRIPTAHTRMAPEGPGLTVAAGLWSLSVWGCGSLNRGRWGLMAGGREWLDGGVNKLWDPSSLWGRR